MNEGTYTLTVTVPRGLDDTEKRVRDALSEEGFGILTEIDVQATLKEKIGEDIGGYRILGACNPPLAHQAIGVDPDIGALLPCNVVLRENGSGTDVVAADPAAMLRLADADGLDELAADVRARIERAIRSLDQEASA